MSSMSIFLLCASTAFVACIQGLSQQRRDEFGRIQSYDIIDVKIIDRSTYGNVRIQKTLSFRLHGEHYELDLKQNERMIASNIKHTNGIPIDSSGKFTSLTESCHYGISSNNKHFNIHGGVSLCHENYVHARISIPEINDVLYLKPAKDYIPNFGSDDDNINGEPSFKHLAYFMSDYDTSGYPWGAAAEEIPPRSRTSLSDILKLKQQRAHNHDHMHDQEKGETSRELLQTTEYYNEDGGVNYTNHVELLIIADTTLYHHYKYELNYGTEWYEYMFEYLMTLINDVSQIYETTNWDLNVGNDYSSYKLIGGISVSIIEIEVFTGFDGIYSSLKPEITSDDQNCSIWDDISCTIFGGGWQYDESYTTLLETGYLAKLVNWLLTYKDFSQFDNVQLFNNAGMTGSITSGKNGIAGVAWLDGMCDYQWSCSVNTQIYGYDWTLRTSAHELGHNFDCPHDQDTICGIDAGIMGYNDFQYTFSNCSIDSVQDYFYSTGGLDCLWDGVRRGVSNITNNLDTLDTKDDGFPTPGPTEEGACPDGSPWECIFINGMMITGSDSNNNNSMYDFNGGWKEYINSNGTKGCFNNKQYFWREIEEDTVWYLFYSNTFNNWHIYDSLASGYAWAWCDDGDINDCTDAFYVYNYSYILDTNVTVDVLDVPCNYNHTYTLEPSSNPTELPVAAVPTINPTKADVCDNNKYGEYVCIHSGKMNDTAGGTGLTLWGIIDIDYDVAVFEENGCDADEPYFVYEHDGGSNSNNILLYLHFAESTREWIISPNTVDDNVGIAICDEYSLDRCLEGSWSVLKSNDDELEWVISTQMTYMAENCDDYAEYATTDAGSNSGSGGGSSSGSDDGFQNIGFAIIGIASAFIVMGIIVGLCVLKNRRKNNKTKKLVYGFSARDSEYGGKSAATEPAYVT